MAKQQSKPPLYRQLARAGNETDNDLLLLSLKETISNINVFNNLVENDRTKQAKAFYGGLKNIDDYEQYDFLKKYLEEFKSSDKYKNFLNNVEKLNNSFRHSY